MAMRNKRKRSAPPPLSRRQPASKEAPDQRAKVLNPSADADRTMAETNGMSRAR